MFILFINHNVEKCGIYQYGKNVAKILEKATNHTYQYCELTSYQDYLKCISDYSSYDAIIYNYNFSTLPWLNNYTIQKIKPNICILHENLYNAPNFDYFISTNPNDTNGILRPLFDTYDQVTDPKIKSFIEYGKDKNIPIIGSFGFGFHRKGFDKIIQNVNKEYTQAIIKLIIPEAHYNGGVYYHDHIASQCKSLVKPGIELIITNEFFNTHDLLNFLASNTINLFLYEYQDTIGISSTIDYALSVDIPIGITNVPMFRHIYHPKISIDHGIENIIQDYTNTHKHLWSHDKFIERMDQIISSIKK
jgi:hypothetical protein